MTTRPNRPARRATVRSVMILVDHYANRRAECCFGNGRIGEPGWSREKVLAEVRRLAARERRKG